MPLFISFHTYKLNQFYKSGMNATFLKGIFFNPISRFTSLSNMHDCNNVGVVTVLKDNVFE